jgi:hypothetical protein
MRSELNFSGDINVQLRNIISLPNYNKHNEVANLSKGTPWSTAMHLTECPAPITLQTGSASSSTNINNSRLLIQHISTAQPHAKLDG